MPRTNLHHAPGALRSRFLAAALALVASAAAAQTGNLVASGRFDDAADVPPWNAIQDGYSSASFDGGEDTDGCALSGAFDAVADPTVDAGGAEFRLCLGPVSTADSFRIAGDFLFPATSPDARVNLTLSYYTGADCTIAYAAGGLFAGYAVTGIEGWQHVAAGPSTPGGDAVSASISILLTQITGSEGPVEVFADNVRVTAADWLFAEDHEIGETCRWSAEQP